MRTIRPGAVSKWTQITTCSIMILRMLSLLATLGLAACATATSALVNSPALLGRGFKLEEQAFGSQPWQKLDIFTPESDGPWDVVVFFHGGRWSSGRKEDYQFVGAALARQGFLTIIPDYRKYPEIRFPTFVKDAAQAVAWIHDTIGARGGRPGRVHLAGHSSGAHVAALLAADESYLEAEGKSVRDVVRSFAGLAGPYAFTPEDPDLRDMFGPPERYAQMRVPTFIAGTEPPMLLLHGADDTTVGAFNHQLLADQIRTRGGNVEVVIYPGVGHVGIVAAFSRLGPSTPVIQDLRRFFEATE
jgi:acetyl esterase/lipase